MHYPMRSLLPSLLALSLGCLPATAAAGQVDFNGLAEKFFKAHPVDDRSVGDVALDELVAEHYALAQIGAIDVRFPREFLEDKGVVEDFKDSLVAILAVHELWLDWIGAPPDQVTKAKADFAGLRKFLKGARAGTGASKAKNFFEIFSGSADVQGALDRLRDGFRSGSMMGVTPLSTKPQVLIVAPNRQHFMELAGAFGARQESSRSLYWNDSLANWTEFGWNETQVIALQYPPLKPNLTDFSEGVAMDSKEPTGLHQNVAQRAAVTLCWHTFGNALDPAFETAIGQVAVIDIYGENNTRSGGSGRSNTTDGMTAFIPGGRSEGGLLPPTNADSEWRVTAGKDYFLKPLKEGQKAGAKGGAKAKEEKLVYFQLKSDDTSKRTYVRAPFFGSAAQGKELPAPEFMTDYLEFFRAYKSAFLHWLREFGAAKPVEAHALFAQLLKGIAEAGSAATFEEVVKESYKVPLSTADLGQDSLEARFLAWLGTK